MSFRYTLTGLSLIFLLSSCFTQKKINVATEFKHAAEQYKGMLATHPDTSKFPQSLNPDGSLRDMPSYGWGSGFFGGSLWYLYEYTKGPEWKAAAEKWTMAMEKEKYNTGTHDLGFMLYCPFGNGLRLTGNQQYRDIMLVGANSLSTRFDPKVGLIKSWNKWRTFDYPVIIDNMMNLEFLFWASKASGDNRYRDLSITHADNTMKNHFRDDYSSYHVVAYDSDGNVLMRGTHQGAADNSAWSRGQSWGLYGYVVMYRETKDPKYLDLAEKIAQFILTHPNLPKDKIPYWDLNAPLIPNEERDASAAAILSSALFELSTYSKKDSKTYRKHAVEILKNLTGPEYKAKVGENGNFLLKHSVGHKPAKVEIDLPLIYADYYFLEALLRYDQLNKNNKLTF